MMNSLKTQSRMEMGMIMKVFEPVYMEVDSGFEFYGSEFRKLGWESMICTYVVKFLTHI